MNFERKHYIYIMLAIILSIVAISAEITTEDLNNKYNKTDETDYLETPRIYYTSGSTNNYLTLNSGSVLAWLINNSVTTNKIELQISKVKLYSDLDMNSHNVTNCLNCGTGTDDLTWQSSKVNKSGDNITGNIKIISDIKLAGNIEVQNETDGLILGNFDFYESQSTQTSMARFLSGRGYYKPSNTILYGKYGNDTIGYTFQLRAQNESRAPYTKGFILRYFPNGSNTAITFFNSTENMTSIIKGNLTIYDLNGSGYAYPCLDEKGKLIRSSIACDLI